MKLTRKQIKDGLDAVPIETVLLGVATSKETRLTAKQKRFAEEVAKGEPKTSAYRKAYNSKGKPSTTSKNAQNLMKNPSIQTQIDAFKVAFEGMKYQTPAHLRTLVIHKLTEKALDEDVPPAQQLKALELLGKITEVALFTERREIVKTDTSEQVKEKLLKSLTLAIKSSGAETVIDTSAEDLLKEITGEHDDNVISQSAMSTSDTDADDTQERMATPLCDSPSGEPTAPPSPDFDASHPSGLHSIPHTRSAPLNNSLQNQDVATITGVRLQENPNITGGGGSKNLVDSLVGDLGKAPLRKDGSHG